MQVALSSIGKMMMMVVGIVAVACAATVLPSPGKLTLLL